MQKPRVIITVDPTGAVKVAADGVKGTGCKALTKPYEDALGVTTGDATKPEFYQQSSQSQQAGA